MDYQNLSYALSQLVHNFGAVAVVAGPLYGLAASALRHVRGLLWLILIGWLVQIISGLLFGGISLYYYGLLPDIRGVAVAALITKILCAGLGAGLVIATLRSRRYLSEPARLAWLWRGLAVLGMVALAAAAFLRWYS